MNSQRSTLLLFLLLGALSAMAQKPLKSLSQLREGDLIFHVVQQDNAITDVTQGIEGYKIDHVAIFYLQNNTPSVIQSIGIGTVITPIDSLFLTNETYLIGRVRGSFGRRESIARALQYLGRAYDHLYLADNEEIYCSELVQLSYVDKRGKPIFQTIPMSFHDAQGNITPYWKEFYSARGMAVPEGEPGTNPAELSRRRNVKILYIMQNAGLRRQETENRSEERRVMSDE